MSLGVNEVTFASTSKSTNSTNKTAYNTQLLSKNAMSDSVNFKGKEMTDDEKKELILKARTKASGYAFWGGLFSVLYYGLRSDEKVARKYDLDPQADKKLIKKIKKEQLVWTLPSCIPGLSIIPGAAAYLYNKNYDSSKIDL